MESREAKANWAIVLAGGEGVRLSELTGRGDGRTVPKQFWSLRGELTLLGDAIARAERIVPRERIVVVVTRAHEEHWRDELADLPRGNVVVQPASRGTVAGVLLPVLRVLRRDRRATVLLLPSDHYVADEDVLEDSLRFAIACASRGEVVLVGMKPDAPETQYGWILPEDDGEFTAVKSFVEKPPVKLAEDLMARGAVWNTSLVAARGSSLVELVADRLQGLAPALWAVSRDGAPPASLDDAYARLPRADFSRDVLQGSERRLRLARARACGWTDLGTPQRVLECLERPLPRRTASFGGRTSLHVLEHAARRWCGAGSPADSADAEIGG